jgi:hypothetical protein
MRTWRTVAYLLALGANQSGFVLALKEIDNDRVIASLMNIPTIARNLLVWPSIGVGNLSVGFLFDAVQVLVQTIQQKC